MKVDVETVTVINRPRADVAGFAGDPTNAPKWYANILSVDWKTPPPIDIGSRMTFIARFLGRRLKYTYEVSELVRGQRLVMQTSEGPFAMQTTYTWADAGPGRTRMTLRNRGEPSGFAGVAAPILKLAMRRANQKDLSRLKQLLER